MTPRLQELQFPIAGQVVGIDITRPLDAESVAWIEHAFDRCNVLVFRGQPMDDDAQQAFIQQFGPSVVTGAIKELARKHNHNPHLLDIATVDEDGNPLTEGSFVHLYNLANQLWHTDGSHAQPPTRLSALSARVLPPHPPRTEYADMRSAYEALPKETREKIDDLVVEHSIVYSRSLLGLGSDAFSEESKKSKPPVRHPLVRVHPRTGRKSLYLSSHASHIVGLPLDAGRALLKELTEFATQPRFVYSHGWQPHDVVMWDNSTSMHRATPYSGDAPRKMRWSGVRELAAV